MDDWKVTQAKDDFDWHNSGLEEIFIKKLSEFTKDYKPDGTKFSISAKYIGTRSVIRFDDHLVDLDATDFEILNYFALGYNAPDFPRYYGKKVRVYYGDKYYWLFMQKQLEGYVRGQNATIKYYPMLWNGELFLLCVGFFDINAIKPGNI
jgi:hypothetical protein